MTDTIHTVTMTDAEMKAYEAGRKAGNKEALDGFRSWYQNMIENHETTSFQRFFFEEALKGAEAMSSPTSLP